MTCNLGDSYHAPNPSSIPRLRFIGPGSKALLTSGDEARQRAIEDARHIILQHWMRLIINCSNRSATLVSDKLTALAGLASYFSPVLGPEYFAGIWGELFLQQLCWHSPSDTIFLSSPLQYRAPSWSWVSLDGPLNLRTYCLDRYRPYRFELVKCTVTLKSKPLYFGEFTGGYLALKGVPREGHFHATRSQRITWQATSHEKDQHDDSVSEGGGYWNFARGFSDTVQDNVDGPIVCLPLYIVEGMDADKVGGLMLNALPGGAFSAHWMFHRRRTRLRPCSSAICCNHFIPEHGFGIDVEKNRGEWQSSTRAR